MLGRRRLARCLPSRQPKAPWGRLWRWRGRRPSSQRLGRWWRRPTSRRLGRWWRRPRRTSRRLGRWWRRRPRSSSRRLGRWRRPRSSSRRLGLGPRRSCSRRRRSAGRGRGLRPHDPARVEEKRAGSELVLSPCRCVFGLALYFSMISPRLDLTTIPALSGPRGTRGCCHAGLTVGFLT